MRWRNVLRAGTRIFVLVFVVYKHVLGGTLFYHLRLGILQAHVTYVHFYFSLDFLAAAPVHKHSVGDIFTNDPGTHEISADFIHGHC
jgi:hypothetical protein